MFASRLMPDLLFAQLYSDQAIIRLKGSIAVLQWARQTSFTQAQIGTRLEEQNILSKTYLAALQQMIMPWLGLVGPP